MEMMCANPTSIPLMSLVIVTSRIAFIQRIGGLHQVDRGRLNALPRAAPNTGRRSFEKIEQGISMHYQVRDLSKEQKHAAEILLGHPVAENEAVSIKSLGPTTIIASSLTPEERIEALHALKARFAERPHAEVSSIEEEEIVNEALRSSRPNYRPAG